MYYFVLENRVFVLELNQQTLWFQEQNNSYVNQQQVKRNNKHVIEFKNVIQFNQRNIGILTNKERVIL